MNRTVTLLLAFISFSHAFSTSSSPSVSVSRLEAATDRFVKCEENDNTGRRRFLTSVAVVIPALAYSNPAFASGGELCV